MRESESEFTVLINNGRQRLKLGKAEAFKAFSSMGEGWTVFEYMGEFGLFGKVLSGSSNSQPVIRSSEVRGISQEMKDALFLP